MQQKFDISGMTCSACSSHVEKSVSKLDGVQKVSVNLVTESMTVKYNDQQLTEQDIIDCVVKSGYGAKVSGQSAQQATNLPRAKKDNTMVVRLTVSIVFMVLLMYVSMGSMIGLPLPSFLVGTNNAVSFALMQLLLCVPVLYVNRIFFISGFKKLFRGGANMDTLIAVGASASIIYGIIALFRMSYGLGAGDSQLVHTYYHDLYFESAAMILTLVTLGKFLEGKSKKRTGDALQKLKNLAPKTALLWSEQGETVVDGTSLKVGDKVIVKAGMSIPADAKVIQGHGFVDESAVSGESVPVEKTEGDSIIGGTVLTSGYVVAVVEGVGEQSMLAKIVRLVEDANAVKPPIAKLADKIAGIFVPVVMSIAAVTLIAWLIAGQTFEFALSCAISVLVISCPCALGLATPLTIMVGTGKGAEKGVLFKSGEALETLHSIKCVVLDKTGTITQGRPEVTEVVAVGDANQLLSIVAGIEKLSEHPLGQAVVEYAQNNNLPLTVADSYKTLVGMGVSAVVDNKQYYVGNAKLMAQCGVDSNAYNHTVLRMSNEGKTPLIVSCGNKYLGTIAVADTIKPDCKEAIANLKQSGIRVVMLTGDNQRTAQAIADKVDIDEVYAEVLPQDKQQVVADIQKQYKVAMVGDGINDAPALTTADVGIAVGCGSDIALDSADVILVKNSLADVSYAIQLSRATIRNVKQNLFWAFFYNTLGIPLAAGVLYMTPLALKLNPMIGAAAMSISSLFVVGNALRLKLFGLRHAKKQQKALNNNGTACASGVCPVEATNEITQCNSQQCSVAQQSIQNDNINKETTNMKTVTVKVQGMMCAHCTGRVQKALNEVKGVQSVEVSLEKAQAQVVCDNSVTSQSLADSVVAAGYQVTGTEE